MLPEIHEQLSVLIPELDRMFREDFRHVRPENMRVRNEVQRRECRLPEFGNIGIPAEGNIRKPKVLLSRRSLNRRGETKRSEIDPLRERRRQNYLSRETII